MRNILKFIIIIFLLNAENTFAQQSYDYNFDTGTTHFKTDLGRLIFGNNVSVPDSNDVNLPPPPSIKVGYSTDLKCGQLDIDAFTNINNYKKLFNDMLSNVEGNLQQTRKLLDDRYLIQRTIGEGRYAK